MTKSVLHLTGFAILLRSVVRPNLALYALQQYSQIFSTYLSKRLILWKCTDDGLLSRFHFSTDSTRLHVPSSLFIFCVDFYGWVIGFHVAQIICGWRWVGKCRGAIIALHSDILLLFIPVLLALLEMIPYCGISASWAYPYSEITTRVRDTRWLALSNW